MDTGKSNPKLWAIVMVVVAIIGACGGLAVCGTPLATRLVDIFLPAPTAISSSTSTSVPDSMDNESASPPVISTVTAERSSADTSSEYHIISLKGVGVPESGNLGLEAGIRKLVGIDFEIGWLATTESEGDRDKPDTLVIIPQQELQNVSKIYFLLQGSWMVNQNTEFGSINIILTDSRTVREPLTPGYNIRDWSQIDFNLSAPNIQEAWEGVGWDGTTKGVVDVLTVEIPADYQSSSISKLEIRDESMTKLNSENPGIHLWAVTAE